MLLAGRLLTLTLRACQCACCAVAPGPSPKLSATDERDRLQQDAAADAC
jgi:hypothetical protein